MEKKSEYENELFLNNTNSDLYSLSKDKLVEELNQLSENFPATKDRMVEIAKVLNAYYMGKKEEENKEKQ